MPIQGRSAGASKYLLQNLRDTCGRIFPYAFFLTFYLIKQTEELPLTKELKDYCSTLNKIEIPDPYSDIKNADQLDMLWADFFATGRIKPIRQIISSFKLSKFAGTLEKVKNKQLDVTSEKVKQQAMLEAIFSSAIWSLGSNCRQSNLLFQYCIGLYQTKELNDIHKVSAATSI